MRFHTLRLISTRVIKRKEAEGMISSLTALIIIIGTLALFMSWFVLNVNNFQLQTALNKSLKKAQIEGYLSPTNIANTKNYLQNSAGIALSNIAITGSPLVAPGGSNYSTEITVTITIASMPLWELGSNGHTVPDASRATTLQATGYIISQYTGP